MYITVFDQCPQKGQIACDHWGACGPSHRSGCSCASWNVPIRAPPPDPLSQPCRWACRGTRSNRCVVKAFGALVVAHPPSAVQVLHTDAGVPGGILVGHLAMAVAALATDCQGLTRDSSVGFAAVVAPRLAAAHRLLGRRELLLSAPRVAGGLNSHLTRTWLAPDSHLCPPRSRPETPSAPHRDPSRDARRLLAQAGGIPSLRKRSPALMVAHRACETPVCGTSVAFQATRLSSPYLKAGALSSILW